MLWKGENGGSFVDAIGVWRVPFAMMLYGALAAPYPLALTVYHISLMARGETTREYVSSAFVCILRFGLYTNPDTLYSWWEIS